MSERTEQLVLEYLSHVNDIAFRHLGAAERLDFMTRLRRRIEEQRATAGGATEPDQVRKVLAKFGDPETLVMRERRRLDGSGDSAAPETTRGQPRRQPGEPPRGPVRRVAQQRRAQLGIWRPSRPQRAEQQRQEHRLSRARQPVDPVKKRPSETGPSGPSGDLDSSVDLDVLFRSQPIEVGAIVLLGLGGLLLPIPLWIFGAVIAVLSRTWVARDKWLGVLVPPLVGVAIVVVNGGVGVLVDGLRTGDAALPLRLAGPVGAIYLGVRLLRAIGVKTVRITRARGRR